MIQNIQIEEEHQEFNFQHNEEEKNILVQLQDHYFFDMNLMILQSALDKIHQIFQIKPEFTSSDEYQEQRKNIIQMLLKYDIGLDILTKLVYKRNQLQLNGYYYLRAIDDLSHILLEIQYNLLQFSLNSKNVDIQISKRIEKLFNSIIRRKYKESEIIEQIQIIELEKDISNLKNQQQIILDIGFFLQNYEKYKLYWQIMYQQITNKDYELLNQIMQSNIEELDKLIKNKSLEQTLIFISKLTKFQQELLLIYLYNEINNNQELQQSKYSHILQSICLADSDLEGKYRIILQNLINYAYEIEDWKILIIQFLIKKHLEQDAYEILLASKIDWNSIQNSDVIIRLLINSGRCIQAYVYATEMQDEQVFRYFIEYMIQENKIQDLLNIELTVKQDIIMNDYISDITKEIILIAFVKKLLRSRKYYQAIQFYQKLEQSQFKIGLNQIEQLIKIKIQMLPKIEEEYYQAKMQHQILSDELKLVESMLNYEAIQIQDTDNDKQIKYFVDQPKFNQKRFINCFGWIRENQFGTIY